MEGKVMSFGLGLAWVFAIVVVIAAIITHKNS
jgi:hypothetical protein